MSKNENILIIRLGALGDIVQATTFFTAIQAQKPTAKITLLTTKPYEELAHKLGLFHEIWIDERPKLLQVQKVFTLRRRVVDAQFDMVIDLQNVDRTRFYKKVLWPKCPPWFCADDQNLHPQKRWPQILQKLNLPNEVGPLDLCHVGDTKLTSLLPKPYVLIVAGSSNAHGGAKRWPEGNFVLLTKALIEQGLNVGIIGGPSDSFNELFTLCPPAVNLVGKTSFYDIIGLGSHAELVIGNDTGPTLLAASGGCPSVTFYSTHNPPTIGGPLGTRHHPLFKENLNDLSFAEVWQFVSTLIKKGYTLGTKG